MRRSSQWRVDAERARTSGWQPDWCACVWRTLSGAPRGQRPARELAFDSFCAIVHMVLQCALTRTMCGHSTYFLKERPFLGGCQALTLTTWLHRSRVTQTLPRHFRSRALSSLKANTKIK